MSTLDDGPPGDATVSPEGLTFRPGTAIGEVTAVTLGIDPHDDPESGCEVTRTLHAGDETNETLEASSTLDQPVTLACARVAVHDLTGAAGVRIVRPVLRRCDPESFDPESFVAQEATFRREGDRFVHEDRAGAPSPPDSSPSYRLERLSGGGLLAGTVIPAAASLRERAFLARKRVTGKARLDATSEAVRLTVPQPETAQTHHAFSIENGAICVWVLGETVGENGVDREEYATCVGTPFPITAADASLRLRDGEFVVTAPRCDRGEGTDGSLSLSG
ncbi:hypothetical protein [Haloarchaeobius sp. DFWS5]|uniref:hypothetical protein n=1 Tax=Haloarchaeobius sp. DFWS5 TaxID=3446114 RepID=UPI003EB7918F